MKPVRTRFAPSPTGLLHVGGIRTALFAWLLARQQSGKFILRLEDTDKSREVEGAKQHIIDSLKALGLTHDEGPDIGGQYGPYVQSDRRSIYAKWAQKIIAEGRAYADVRTTEELQALREDARAKKKPFLAREYRPSNPPVWLPGMPLRFKSDPKAYVWHDEIMGDISTGPEVVDDFILVKSDGLPTYNFAHIIDDAEMQISHIFRGQEFIASVPNYLNLYEALGIEAPVMAHMPHIMAEGGKRKLSKRDGAKDVLDYIREGYTPEALRSFIATMGWNDGTEQETFTTDELIQKFSLGRIGKSGALFDEKRLEWVNGTFIRNMTIDDLSDRVAAYWPEEAASFDESYRRAVLQLTQERLKFFAELPDLTRLFFIDLPINLELITGNKQLKKLETAQLTSYLQSSRDMLANVEFDTESIRNGLNSLLETLELKPGILFSLIRIATTQSPFSPSLPESLHVLGRETVLRRIDTQLAAL